jgi:excisionase family DNA binding protein
MSHRRNNDSDPLAGDPSFETPPGDDPRGLLPYRREVLLLTPAEVAAALNLGRSTVYLLIADGSIRSVRIGRSRRVTIADLNAYVENLRARTVSAVAVSRQRDTGRGGSRR